jgi:hypothetical protein
MTDFGAQERRDLISRAIRVYDEEGDRRTDPVMIKGERKILKVIRLNPDVLLLNHDSFRLAGQLRDLDMRELVHSNPTSIESQQILERLLKSTSEYRTILDDLRLSGQANPGLITRDGLLINGNTRTVALRELGVTGVDVAVLPEDVTSQDFLDLEVEFQMRKLAHQEYTYSNQLLMISELSERGFSDVEIAKKMNWRKRGREKVSQALRILSMIDEIRALNPGQIPYSRFDAKKEHLINLDAEYQQVQQTDPTAANKLKWSRILAIFLGATKDQVRVIDEDFIQLHVLNRVNEDSRELIEQSVNPSQNSEPDDLEDILEDDDNSESNFDPKTLVTTILNTVSTDETEPGNADPLEQFQDMAEAVRLGAISIISDNIFQSMLTEPADVLRETRMSLENILSKYAELSSTAGFDGSKFGYELKKVSKVVSDLETIYKQ